LIISFIIEPEKRKATIAGGLLGSPIPQVLAMEFHGIGDPEAYNQKFN
jgi:hypothetical protein